VYSIAGEILEAAAGCSSDPGGSCARVAGSRRVGREGVVDDGVDDHADTMTVRARGQDSLPTSSGVALALLSRDFQDRSSYWDTVNFQVMEYTDRGRRGL